MGTTLQFRVLSYWQHLLMNKSEIVLVNNLQSLQTGQSSDLLEPDNSFTPQQPTREA